tara:strand:+ start:17297 stop:18067 length:771 start_codon:yes stop_codon:yes gene_type:complete
MGILNLTENSFYDGGKYNSLKKCLYQCEKMIKEGAHFIDIGVHSSKPGSKIIDPKHEKILLLPYLYEILKEFNEVFFSIDTYNSEIAKISIEMGISIINDISAGSIDDKMFSILSKYDIPYIMMHMKGKPDVMQKNPEYDNVTGEIIDFLSKKIKYANKLGIKNIIIDPGFGFGKSESHNYELLKNLRDFEKFNYPILVGLSRKSMIYKKLNTSPEFALNGTTAIHAWALERGAKILRVHDVKEAKECITLWKSLQ